MGSMGAKGGRLEMDEKEARELLGSGTIQDDGNLYDLGWYLEWLIEEDYATLNGTFEAEELEAIAWWMKNKKEKGE